MEDVTLAMRNKIAGWLDEMLVNAKPKQLLETITQENGLRQLFDTLAPGLESYLKPEGIPSAFLRDSRTYLETHLEQKIKELTAAEERAKLELTHRALNSNYLEGAQILEQLQDEPEVIAHIGANTDSLFLAMEAVEILASKTDVDGLIRIGKDSELPIIRKLAQDKLSDNPDALLRILEVPDRIEDKDHVLGMFSDDYKLGVCLNLEIGYETRAMALERITDPEQLKLITLNYDFSDVPLLAIKRLEEKFPDALSDNTFNMAVWDAPGNLPKDFVKRSIARITDPELLKAIILDPSNREHLEAIKILEQKYPDSMADEQFNIAAYSAKNYLPPEFVEKSMERISSSEGRAMLVLDTDLSTKIRLDHLNTLILDAKASGDTTTFKKVLYELEERNAKRDKRNTPVDRVLSPARGKGISLKVKWEQDRTNELKPLLDEVKKELVKPLAIPFDLNLPQVATQVQDNKPDAQEDTHDTDPNLPTFTADVVLAERYKKIPLETLKGIMSETFGISTAEIEEMHPNAAEEKVEELASRLNKELIRLVAEDKKVSLKGRDIFASTDVEQTLEILERKQKIREIVKTLETLAEGGLDITDAVETLFNIAKEHEKYLTKMSAMNALRHQVITTRILIQEIEQFTLERYLDISDKGNLPNLAFDILNEILDESEIDSIRRERERRFEKEKAKTTSEFGMPWEGTTLPKRTDPISLEKKMIERLHKLSEKQLESYAIRGKQENVCLAAIERIDNIKRLSRIAKEAKFESVRNAADEKCKLLIDANKALKSRIFSGIRKVVQGTTAVAALILVSMTFSGHAEVQRENVEKQKPRIEQVQTEQTKEINEEIAVRASKPVPSVVQEKKLDITDAPAQKINATPEPEEVKVAQPKLEEVKVVPEVKVAPEPSKEPVDDAVSYDEQKPFQDNVEKAVVADAPTIPSAVDSAAQNPVSKKEFKLTEMLPDTPELPVNQEEVALLQLQRTIEGSLDTGNYDNLSSLFKFKAKTSHEGKWIGWQNEKEDNSVSNLQLLLRNVGYDTVELTSQYDKDTEQAVRHLQKTMLREGIALEFGADGKFGTETWTGLQKHLRNQKNDAKSMLTDYMGFKGKFASNARPGPSMQLNRI